MNILNLLTNEKRVAGIEINEQVVHIVYFRKRKNRKGLQEGGEKLPENEIILIEEPIPANIISNGIILEAALLSKMLKNLWRREKLKKFYAIVSIPEDKVYSKTLSLPKTENEEHLEQAINLAIDFQFPIKRDDSYIGWENTKKSEISNEIIVSAIPKDIADLYIKVLENAGINTLALETHVASIARAINLKKDEATLLTKTNKESTTIIGLKNNIVTFSRTLPHSYVTDDTAIITEKDKIKNSLEADLNQQVIEIPFRDIKVREDYQKYPELISISESQSKWLISIGAAIRGEIPNGQDELISLLPVGTVEAYKYQNVKIFIGLIRNLIIGVSIFFIGAYLASYFLIFSLSQTVNNTINSIKIPSVSADTTEKQNLINKVNSLTILTQSILNDTTNWSILIDEINSKVIDGIIISNFSAPSKNDIISISGIASNRTILNLFKKSLQESAYLTSVELPITNLEQKGDIPFSISFKLKDPNILNFK